MGGCLYILVCDCVCTYLCVRVCVTCVWTCEGVLVCGYVHILVFVLALFSSSSSCRGVVLVSVLSYFVQSYMCVQLCYVFSFITFYVFSCHVYSLILVCRLCILYMLAVLTYGTSCNNLNVLHLKYRSRYG